MEQLLTVLHLYKLTSLNEVIYVDYEEKLSYFAEVIMREVDTKRRQVTHQIANDISGDIAAAISNAEQTAKSRVEAVRREIRRAKNKKIASAITELKIQYINVRNQKVDKLFEDVKVDLLDFTRSPEYPKFIIEKLSKLQKTLRKTLQKKLQKTLLEENIYVEKFTYVRLCPRDMHLAESILESTGLIAESGTNEFIGGFILISKNRRMQIDYTFKTCLNEAKREFGLDYDEDEGYEYD